MLGLALLRVKVLFIQSFTTLILSLLMSYRKAKQLLEQKKIQEQKTAIHKVEEEHSPEEEQETLPAKKQTNMFQDFGGDDSSEEQPTKDKQAEQKKQEQEVQKKKKKKNKKKKAKPAKEDPEDVEKMFKQVGMEYQSKEMHENFIKEEEWQTILQINENKFNYERQLRRHFGRAGTLNEEGGEDSEMTKKQHKMQKHLRKMMKRSFLAPGIKEFFPIREKFEIQRQDDMIKIMPTKKYDHYQIQYEAVRNSNDINALFAFSQTHPEHVDSLYAVGEFLRLQGNYRDADSLIQRVIYIYEMAAGYDLQQFIKHDVVKKYINYDTYSTSLFMSLFKFMDILGKKGCFRAALEYNKLLLKINMNDPTACMLCLDYNAISSKSNDFLLNFVKNYSCYMGDKTTNLYLMPNFTYSTALARFHTLFVQSEANDREVLVEENNLVELVSFNEEDWKIALKLPNGSDFAEDSPKSLLLRAILVYPKLMVEIARKNEYAKQFLNCPSFQGNQKKTFKQILEHDFWSMVPDSYSYHFLKLQNEDDSRGLDKVLEVYVERSKILWKSNEVMTWVKGAMGFILNQIDSEQFVYQEYLEALCTEQSGGMPIPFPLRRYQNISRANFSDRVDRIDLANIQDNQQQMPANQNRMSLQGNPFTLFLNSLLPWVNLPAQQNNDPDMPDIEEDDY